MFSDDSDVNIFHLLVESTAKEWANRKSTWQTIEVKAALYQYMFQ
jgi:hypothetical protein